MRARDDKELFVHEWAPDEGTPRGIVHIAHGMAEHGARYARLAEALTGAGYVVYANDHRGHGATARTPDELGIFAAQGGFRLVVDDLALHVEREKAAHPGLPLALFGHSMGSFLVQQVMYERGRELAAVVLSASNGKPTPIAAAGRLVARAERLRLGPRGKSPVLRALSFDAFNKAFKPNRTAADWLSRDAAEVDKYVADPLCGFMCSTTLWIDLLDALPAISDPANQARIPKDLPVLVLAGSEDPVSERTKGLEQLLGAYRAAGLCDVRSKFYPGARHEIVNETNRDEVTRDIVTFLDAKLARP
jgi:alpha-beta hydrolase superfamily lysophospholipase